MSTGDDPIESPLSWRDYEWQVKNPEGQTSEWVTFSYPFDDALLNQIREDSIKTAEKFLSVCNFADAIEPLRKAMVFADRIFGKDDQRTIESRKAWEAALDNQGLSKLRFNVGLRVRVVEGTDNGKVGTITDFIPRNEAYVVQTEAGTIWVKDREVELSEETD